jgi:hypothetical protein
MGRLIGKVLCYFGRHKDMAEHGWTPGGHPNLWHTCQRCGNVRITAPDPVQLPDFDVAGNRKPKQ